MQMVSDGDNLHEMSGPVFRKKKLQKEKYNQFVIRLIRPEIGKRLTTASTSRATRLYILRLTMSMSVSICPEALFLYDAFHI